MIEQAGVWGLFLSSLISSTLLPGGSEVLLGYLVGKGESPLWQLLLSATLGNTLGGFITYGMGAMLAIRWPLTTPDKKQQQRALNLIRRYGVVALLFSWLPVIGDPLCFIAGWLRLAPWLSLLLILTGKAARYGAIVYAFS